MEVQETEKSPAKAEAEGKPETAKAPETDSTKPPEGDKTSQAPVAKAAGSDGKAASTPKASEPAQSILEEVGPKKDTSPTVEDPEDAPKAQQQQNQEPQKVEGAKEPLDDLAVHLEKIEKTDGKLRTGWGWFKNASTGILSTIKAEVSTVAVGVKQAVSETVKEVREDFKEMTTDIRHMIGSDAVESTKDSKRTETALKRLNLIDKRIGQLNLITQDLIAFRSILLTKQAALKSFLATKKIGGQPAVEACHDLSKSLGVLDDQHTRTDGILDARISQPLGIVVERIQIARDLYTQYCSKKQEFEQQSARAKKAQVDAMADRPEASIEHQQQFEKALQALGLAETDFVDSVKNLQKFVETNVAEKFKLASSDLTSGKPREAVQSSEDEDDADILQALESSDEDDGEDDDKDNPAGENVVIASEAT